MKKAAKKKRSAHILPWLLMMAAAVALGLYMPGFFTRIQNNRTDNTREVVDLGSSMLSITSDSAKLEKLGLFSEENSYNAVSINGGQNMTEAEAADVVYEIPRIIEGTDLPYTQFGGANLMYTEPQLIVSDNSNVTTAIVWLVYYGMQDGEKYYELAYAVDDSTGIILAARYGETGIEETDGTNSESEPSYIEDSSDAVRRIAENLTAMYKFTNTTAELDNSVSIGDNYRYSINFYTDGSRELTMPVHIWGNGWQINGG